MKRKLSATLLAFAFAASAGGGALATGHSGFSDVPADHERRADIEYAAARGWFQSYEDGTFQPGRTVAADQIAAVISGAFPEGATRADLATFVRAGSEAIAAYTAVIDPDAFPDAAGHPQQTDIDTAAARGWFLGYPDGNFRPDRTVTAAQTAAVTGRAFPEGASRADLAAFLRAGNQALLDAGRAPAKSDEPAYTRYFVQQAVNRYEEQGRQAAFGHYNSADSVDGQWYVFVIEDNEIIVHSTRPELLNTGVAHLTDIYGKPYGKELAGVSEEGGWIDYVFLNPATGQNRQKHSWVIRHDGLVFGSGWYEDQAPPPPTKENPAAYTQYFVQQAIDRYEEQGRQAVIDHYNSTDSVDGPWYIFMVEDDILIVTATRPELLNTRSSHLTDVYGRPSGREVSAATEVGSWVDYVFLNPATGQNRQKHSWVIRHDGLVFGSGWYEDQAPPPPTKENPAAYTQYFVQQAIDRYEEQGRQAVIDHYNSTDSVDGPWYIFIIDDGVTVSIATNPELVGTRTGPRTDVNGKNYGQELAAATEAGSWVDYVRRNPATDQLEQKHSWVIRRDGLIFGSGWYEPVEPAS